MTPEQRAQLDVARARRDQRRPLTAEPKPAPVAAPLPQGPEVVAYGGAVRRSDGKLTVWINGKLRHDHHRSGSAGKLNRLGMRNDGAVAIAVFKAGRTVSLKVGQSLNVNCGRIE